MCGNPADKGLQLRIGARPTGNASNQNRTNLLRAGGRRQLGVHRAGPRLDRFGRRWCSQQAQLGVSARFDDTVSGHASSTSPSSINAGLVKRLSIEYCWSHRSKKSAGPNRRGLPNRHDDRSVFSGYVFGNRAAGRAVRLTPLTPGQKRCHEDDPSPTGRCAALAWPS